MLSSAIQTGNSSLNPRGEADADQEHQGARVSGEREPSRQDGVRSEMVATEIMNTAAIRMA